MSNISHQDIKASYRHVETCYLLVRHENIPVDRGNIHCKVRFYSVQRFKDAALIVKNQQNQHQKFEDVVLL